ncbi:hypothetical protein BGZ65_008749 [Modicella reniformis]|uniref:DUSP domain-containing protein n=1 Tax=Modicella reniformis TaxID=1440133 RepID=A0A9P6J4H9_9FUNG|nr:hypothetical protein BGZ65_008749 [Modicella reniformis]
MSHRGAEKQAYKRDKLYNWMHRRDIDEFERKAKAVRSPAAAWVSRAWLTDWQRHSRLSSDKTKRKLINKTALEVLTRVFGAMSLPESGVSECDVCRDELQPYIDIKKGMALQATSEKQDLMDMVIRGARIRHFMKKWLAYVKRPTVNERPTAIDNTNLVCKHSQFVFDLDNDADKENEDDICLIKEEEWAYLHALYGGGPEVVVSMTEGSQTNGNQAEVQSTTESTPALCVTCRSERFLNFSSTTLVIRIYTPGASDTKNDDSSAISPPAGYTTSEQNGECFAAPAAKRKQAPDVLGQEIGTRRSKRSKTIKKSYKEIKVVVGKLETIMGKTDVVPLYQKLVHGKVELDKNEATMAELAIPPNAVLDMIAFDQSMEDLALSTLEDVAPAPGDVGGFGGTGLAEEWL